MIFRVAKRLAHIVWGNSCTCIYQKSTLTDHSSFTVTQCSHMHSLSPSFLIDQRYGGHRAPMRLGSQHHNANGQEETRGNIQSKGNVGLAKQHSKPCQLSRADRRGFSGDSISALGHPASVSSPTRPHHLGFLPSQQQRAMVNKIHSRSCERVVSNSDPYCLPMSNNRSQSGVRDKCFVYSKLPIGVLTFS